MVLLNAYRSTIELFNLSLCPNFSKLRQCIIASTNTVNFKNHLLIFFTLSICYLSLMILLIQSGDIEINTGPIQRVIRGSFHQGDQIFGQTAGTQCMCNALHSFGYSIIENVCYWSTWDMDYILTAGNSLYSSLGFRSQLLSIDELPDSICIENVVISIIKTNLETGLMTGSLEGQFLQNNNHFNKNSSDNGIIFIMAGFSFAVIWSENGCYFFDSHSRDINGFPSPVGTSVLLKFGSVYEVQEYIREVYLAKASKMSQYYQIQYLSALPPPVEV